MTDKDFLGELPAAKRPQPNLAELLTFLHGPLDIRSLALSGLFILALFSSLYIARAVFLPVILAILLRCHLDSASLAEPATPRMEATSSQRISRGGQQGNCTGRKDHASSRP